MFVLGIDPGLSRCGFAVVEKLGRQTEAVTLGVIRTPPKDAIPRRLALLQTEVRSLIQEFKPETVAIERVFFQVNVKTAIGVAQSSGIVMAEAIAHGSEVAEYTPNQIKEAVGGWGAADKKQMQKMVQTLLQLPSLPTPADAADAAATALCHLAHMSMQKIETVSRNK
jgi:crossover junction endodeoxyribonuclease RuvC